MKHKFVIFIVFVFALVRLDGIVCAQPPELEALVQQGNHQEADNYCQRFDGDQRRHCYEMLGELYANRGEYVRAVYFYRKAGNPDRARYYLQLLESTYAPEEVAYRLMNEISWTQEQHRQADEKFYRENTRPILKNTIIEETPVISLPTLEAPRIIREERWIEEPAPFPDWRRALPQKPALNLTIKDYGWGNDPPGEFPDQAVSSGIHIVNINHARRYSVYFTPNLPYLPNARYMRLTNENGTHVDLDLSRYHDHFENSSMEPGNRQLLDIVKFTALDANKQEISAPLWILFRNMKRYNAVRLKGIAKMDTKYICSTLGGNWPKSNSPACLRNFNYESYILAHPNWVKALDYGKWTPADKTTFYKFLEQLETNGSLNSIVSHQGIRKLVNYAVIPESKAKEISLLYAANSLFMEVNGKLYWSIENMEAELMQTLFHRRYILVEKPPVGGLEEYIVLYFMDTHPNNLNDWALKIFMRSTPEKTIYALADWVGKNIVHNRVGLNPRLLQDFTTFNNDKLKVTVGCNATSRYMASIARSLNIPALMLLVKHTTIYFPSIGKGMVHGDDAYDMPPFCLDNPFTENIIGQFNALFYYRSFDPPGSYANPAKYSQQHLINDKKVEVSWSTYWKRLQYLHLTPDAHILAQTCRGYNAVKSSLLLMVKAIGEPAFQRYYCCSLKYLPRYFRYTQDNCAANVDPQNPDCTKVSADCYDVQFLPQFRLNLFPKNSPEEKKFLAGSEVPADFLQKLQNDPNFVPKINDGSPVQPFEILNFKQINRFVLKFKNTAVWQSW